MTALSCYAVIPAYQPDDRLPALAAQAAESGFETIVVDDGSGPDYADIFSRTAEHAHVITCPVNRGQGHAMTEAFALLQPNVPAGSVIVILDCDGQHTVKDALRLCEAAAQAPGTLILGSRKQSKDSPLRSRFGNAVTRAVFKLASGVRIYDTQTGMRAFSASLLPKLLAVPGERYEYEMNTLLQFAECGIPMREMDIATIYIDNNAGSHFHPLRDSARIYKEILKFSGASLISFFIDYLAYSLLLLGFGSGAALAANAGARLISATANYQLNRRFVFHADGSIGKSALQYAALAAGILLCNTVLLWGLTAKLGMNALAAKLIVELLLFAASYLIQKRLIFRRKALAA